MQGGNFLRYVDVNILVYWLGDDPVFGERATRIMERIENGEEASTSALTLWLVHVVLSRLASRYSTKELLRRLDELIFLRIEPLLTEDFEAAIGDAEKYGLDLEDALHFSTAKRLGVEGIYTFDKDFSRTPLQVLNE